jgi:hypothetical protein
MTNPEPVINLRFYDPCIVTAEEYEGISRDVAMRAVLGDVQPGDRILAKLILGMEYRYHEVMQIRAHTKDGENVPCDDPACCDQPPQKTGG